jgi:hypothetical protein
MQANFEAIGHSQAYFGFPGRVSEETAEIVSSSTELLGQSSHLLLIRFPDFVVFFDTLP